MKPDGILLTRNVDLAKRVKGILGRRIAVLPGWIAEGQRPGPLLIVDASALSPSEWDQMVRWSRVASRVGLVLVDDGRVSRERLARVAAEALVSSTATDRELKERIEEQMWDRPFRIAAQPVAAADQIPHPLGSFLANAFIHGVRKVRTLALSLGMSESTLRNQWRRYRSDPAMRLEDVLHRIHDLRRTVHKEPNTTNTSSLIDLVTSITQTDRPGIDRLPRGDASRTSHPAAGVSEPGAASSTAAFPTAVPPRNARSAVRAAAPDG